VADLADFPGFERGQDGTHRGAAEALVMDGGADAFGLGQREDLVGLLEVGAPARQGQPRVKRGGVVT